MKLHQLRALAAVSETGSMQEASRLLHVTQPALSKAIKELEASVGAALFVRTNKGVQLTPYGQRLVGHARLISENVRRARQDLEDMKGTVVSEITVAVTPVTALLRPAGACITAFRRDFPSAQLRLQEMRPAQMLEHLREGVQLLLHQQPGGLHLRAHPHHRRVGAVCGAERVVHVEVAIAGE